MTKEQSTNVGLDKEPNTRRYALGYDSVNNEGQSLKGSTSIPSKAANSQNYSTLLSSTINVASILILASGFISGLMLMSEREYGVGLSLMGSGIITSLFFFALSRILEAAEKYLRQ